MDRLSKKKRGELMSKIRSVSKMELAACGFATEKAGCTLRHQPRNIPGRPDYGNKVQKVAVFIHGCFWHVCCKHGRFPKTNRMFWRRKLTRNVERHRQSKRALARLGYRVLTIWEHDIIR